eukprot:GHVR01109303.1.p1 GENE.GHVR01109303.1~~GHVR01109303.1.p1  ORF type:complete len:178 (+),score=33.82 GHVR01109303.1:50-583(+)
MLWVDKYRPRTLDDLLCHSKITSLLKGLNESKEFPHLLFYGPPGGGKKTRVLAFLREVFGEGVFKVKVETRSFKIPPSNSTTVDIQILSSAYHIEVTPSEVGNKDRAVVQHLLKEVASSPPLQLGDAPKFKVVLISEVDALSQHAQAALRRTMEKYMSTCSPYTAGDSYSIAKSCSG